MKLPNAERAVVDIEKLSGYCLNVGHLRGRHKARVFESVLGLTSVQADQLRDALLEAVHAAEAVAGTADAYGQRFVVDFMMKGPKGRAMVRSSWIVRTDEAFPRLTSCYVL